MIGVINVQCALPGLLGSPYPLLTLPPLPFTQIPFHLNNYSIAHNLHPAQPLLSFHLSCFLPSMPILRLYFVPSEIQVLGGNLNAFQVLFQFVDGTFNIPAQVGLYVAWCLIIRDVGRDGTNARYPIERQRAISFLCITWTDYMLR